MLEEIEELRDEGLISHVGFTTEAQNRALYRFLETERFEVIQTEYNLIFQHRFDPQFKTGAMYEARERGLGIVTMRSLTAGVCTRWMKMIRPDDDVDYHPALLQFCLSNPLADVVLAGMRTADEVERNVAVANDTSEGIDLDAVHKHYPAQSGCEKAGRVAKSMRLSWAHFNVIAFQMKLNMSPTEQRRRVPTRGRNGGLGEIIEVLKGTYAGDKVEAECETSALVRSQLTVFPLPGLGGREETRDARVPFEVHCGPGTISKRWPIKNSNRGEITQATTAGTCSCVRTGSPGGWTGTVLTTPFTLRRSDVYSRRAIVRRRALPWMPAAARGAGAWFSPTMDST